MEMSISYGRGDHIAVLGAGKMGSSLLAAMIKSGSGIFSNATATVKHAHRAASVSKQLGIMSEQTIRQRRAMPAWYCSVLSRCTCKPFFRRSGLS